MIGHSRFSAALPLFAAPILVACMTNPVAASCSVQGAQVLGAERPGVAVPLALGAATGPPGEGPDTAGAQRGQRRHRGPGTAGRSRDRPDSPAAPVRLRVGPDPPEDHRRGAGARPLSSASRPGPQPAALEAKWQARIQILESLRESAVKAGSVEVSLESDITPPGGAGADNMPGVTVRSNSGGSETHDPVVSSPVRGERSKSDLDREFQQAAKACKQKHVRFLYSNGGMYRVYNNNLLYHGCISLKPDGSGS